jgi:RNA polymerase sigma-70 factor (sigma-E family)
MEPTGLVAPAEEVKPAVAFEEFFRAEYARLARALLLMVGDRSEAEDVAQEALARVYERWDRVRGMDSPAGYVYRTALNLHRKRLRRLGVRARRVLTGSPEPDPAEAVEAGVDVRRALAELPVGQREALVLVTWLGMTADEAGRVLGIDPASVRGRLHRGRTRLRELLGVSDE